MKFILETKTTKMNGTKNGSSSNSNDVKYPANCAMRLGSTPGYADDGDNDMYEPKQNKKIWRILTVLVYVFTVSFGKFCIVLKIRPVYKLMNYLLLAIWKAQLGAVHKRRHQSRGEGGLPKDDLT